jgi:hypothetical protein
VAIHQHREVQVIATGETGLAGLLPALFRWSLLETMLA